MNLLASLTAAEVEVLENFKERPLQDAARNFETITNSGTSKDEDTFLKALRIKNTLDQYEEASHTAPSWRVLAVLFNGEYLLRRLNGGIPLKQNPFLSHWVETIQRLERLACENKVGVHDVDLLEHITTEKITTARLLWIKFLLQKEQHELQRDNTPYQMSLALLRNGLSRPFHLEPFVRMLEDEGIYDSTPEPDAIVPATIEPLETDSHSSGAHTNSRELHPPADSLQRRKADILTNLKKEPETAIFEITRLPVTLPYLDFLTTILADRTLEKHSIDPAPIITQYIQHALRTIERMDKPPSPPSGLETELPGEPCVDLEHLEYGKEAQSRHVRLLLLFIKSLIRKDLVEMDVLFYEIAEITVRYVWIKEVREFKLWAEEGIEAYGGG